MKLQCARNLDVRLKTIREEKRPRSQTHDVPEIRLENEVPRISIPETGGVFGDIHERHSSALLRILFLHASINPANRSPHVPILLAPLYSVLNQDTEPEELAHVEADTFWLFEALVAEFSELEDEDGGRFWMKRFSERLAWADRDLGENLVCKTCL